MVALWILLALVALFWLLLAMPLRIFLTYDEELHYRIKYGPFPLIDSRKEPKEKPAATQKEAQQPTQTEKKSSSMQSLLNFLGLSEVSSAASFKNSVRQKGIIGTLQAVCYSVKQIFKRIFRLVRKATFQSFNLRIIVGDEDCADAALQYGQVCAVAFPLLSFLEHTIRFKEQNVDIRCDYTLEETQVRFDGQLYYRPWHFVCFLCGLIVNYFKIKARKEK